MRASGFIGIALATGLTCFSVQGALAAPTCKIKPFADGAFNSAAEEYRISFTPDGLTAYFARGESFFPASRKATIYVSQFAEGKWSEPTVAPFSGTHADIDPFVTKDGNRIYFTSIRPVNGTERADLDIWYVEKTGDAWGEPVNATAANSPADELYPTITPKGALIFGSDRLAKGKDFDLFEAAGAAATLKAAKPMNDRINTKAWEYNPIVVPVSREGKAQSMLLFTALNRKGGRGLGDLFVTPLDTKLPLQPEPIRSAINSEADEYHASLKPDAKSLVFVRRKAGKTANGDFFEATWPACAFGPTLG
jgi:hypothetical protein